MGRFSTLVSILILLLIININQATKPLPKKDDLIQQTCQNTQYFDLCISSLKSDPSSSQSDLKGLATIMVHIGIANASETYTYLSSQFPTSSSDSSRKKVYQLCATNYANALDSLKSSLQDLAVDNYDYASMHVMGAAEYPNACRNSFGRARGSGYPAGLNARIVGFEHICSVVLGILEQLFSIGN